MEQATTSKKLWRTLIRLERIFYDQDGEEVVEVMIPAWNPDKRLTYLSHCFPYSLVKRVRLGEVVRTHVKANIGAKEGEQIYLVGWELA